MRECKTVAERHLDELRQIPHRHAGKDTPRQTIVPVVPHLFS